MKNEDEKEFVKRLANLADNEDVLKKGGVWARFWRGNDARTLGRHVFVNQIFSLVQQAISPFAALRHRWLASTVGIAGAHSLVSGVQENTARATHIDIYNRTVESLTTEAMTTMPEIEREFKGYKLEKNINTIGNEVSTFYRNRFQKYASILGVVASGAGMLSLNPLFLGLALPAYGLGHWISARRKYLQNVIFPHEWQARMNVWNHQDAAIRNPEVHATTGDTEKQKQALKRAQGKLTEITEARRKKDLPLVWAQVLGISGMTALTLLAGYLQGMTLPALIGLYAATNAFLGSIGAWTMANYSEKETLRDMVKNYNELKHTKEFDLQTGKQKLPTKTDAIHLEFVKYSHRKRQRPEMGKRQEKAVLDFGSEVTFVPGINVLGGASGAGKSTLYKLLRHADDLDRGSIYFGTIENGKFKGVPLTSISLDDANKPLAFSLPELRHVENITGVELIRESNPKLKLASIKKMAKLFGVPLWHDEACRKPKGMDELSSGEKKRTLCMSALVSPKPILILDEPTSGVDGANVDKILREINALGKTKTIIYTTHHPDELLKLDVKQVVDLDRKKSNEKGEMLPTDVTIQPFTTEAEKKAYIDLCNHRGRKEEEETKEEVPEKEQTLLEILAENETLPEEKIKPDNNEYMQGLVEAEQMHKAVRVYHAIKETRKKETGLRHRIKLLVARSILESTKQKTLSSKREHPRLNKRVNSHQI